MRTLNLSHEITRTGTSAIVFSYTNSVFTDKKTVLFDEQGQIIAVLANYGTTPSETHQIEGTQVESFLANVSKHVEKFGCLWNTMAGEIANKVFFAAKIQAHEMMFHYDNPIYKILDSVNPDLMHLYREIFANESKIKELETTVSNLRISRSNIIKYGTDNLKKVEAIKEKEAKILAKAKAKKIKEKVVELKAQLKSGSKYIAVMRIYANKGRKYLGESLEYRSTKPTTKVYYELELSNLERVASKLIAV